MERYFGRLRRVRRQGHRSGTVGRRREELHLRDHPAATTETFFGELLRVLFTVANEMLTGARRRTLARQRIGLLNLFERVHRIVGFAFVDAQEMRIGQVRRRRW